MTGPEFCPKCKGLHFNTADGSLEILSITHSPPKRPVGRPKTITDMKAYKAAKAREYRARKADGTSH